MILMSDFNMGESLCDRANFIGQVLHGTEKDAWLNFTREKELFDIFKDIGFTWNNIQVGPLHRAACLDKIYLSNMLASRVNEIECVVDKSVFISDHSPIVVKCRNSATNLRNGWFHADASLFKLHAVQ